MASKPNAGLVVTTPPKTRRLDWKALCDENNAHLPPDGQEPSYEFKTRTFRQGKYHGASNPE